MSHSLRPASLEGHMALYKNVLHHSANQIPKWFLETIGVYVSLLNACDYCVEHHFSGLQRLLNDESKGSAIRGALEAARETGAVETDALTTAQCGALAYSFKLTKTPSNISQTDIALLRDAGWDDGEILEINQVAAYFSYANRTVLGLGVTTDGDELGLSPNNSDNENDWGHR